MNSILLWIIIAIFVVGFIITVIVGFINFLNTGIPAAIFTCVIQCVLSYVMSINETLTLFYLSIPIRNTITFIHKFDSLTSVITNFRFEWEMGIFALNALWFFKTFDFYTYEYKPTGETLAKKAENIIGMAFTYPINAIITILSAFLLAIINQV